MPSKTVFRIEVELGNDAMRTTRDIKHLLRDLAGKVENLANGGEERRILDENGNTVGKWGFYLK